MASVVLPKGAEQRQEAFIGTAAWKLSENPIPIDWRMALGSLVAIVLLMGANLYAIVKLREVSTLSIELVSQRYPAIESAKWLLTNLYTQLTSEKKYLVVRDPWYLMEFRDEAEEFTQTLTVLQDQESSPEGRALLGEAERLYAEYRTLFRTHINQQAGLALKGAAQYGMKRDAVVALIAQRFQAYIGLHETQVSLGVQNVRSRSAQVNTLTQFTITAILLASGAAGVAGFRLWRLLRRRQDPATQAGFGKVEPTADGEAPVTLREVNNRSTVLTNRTWLQLRQAAPQIWKRVP
jgi:CHASE3 domain sensor protein